MCLLASGFCVVHLGLRIPFYLWQIIFLSPIIGWNNGDVIIEDNNCPPDFIGELKTDQKNHGMLSFLNLNDLNDLFQWNIDQ